MCECKEAWSRSNIRHPSPSRVCVREERMVSGTSRNRRLKWKDQLMNTSANKFQTCVIERGRIVVKGSPIFTIMEAYTWEGGAPALRTVVEVDKDCHESIMTRLAGIDPLAMGSWQQSALITRSRPDRHKDTDRVRALGQAYA